MNARAGGGKSLVYQLPSLLTSTVTLVVSPLVSLMHDQLVALRRLDIDAATLTQATDKAEVHRARR